MSDKSTTQKGREGEQTAAAYLESKGYTVLEYNYFFERAEVDLVAYDSEQEFIVFLEVKKRSTASFGDPVEAITEDKKQNIYKASEAWLYERKMDGSPVRFDVITIVQQKNEVPDINHYEDAFRPGF